MVRVEIAIEVKPGRLEAAVADMQTVNEITQRLAGVTGQMFVVGSGANAFGGVRLVWDFPSNEALGRWEDASAADPAFQELYGRVTGAESAWVVPAPRELLTQIV